MEQEGRILSSTTSLCPKCLNRVPGRYVAKNDSVYLSRDCPEHGRTSRQVWGSLEHWEWSSKYGPDPSGINDELIVENSHACLAVIEVTQDCNLSCSYCFASSGPGGKELPQNDVLDLLDVVRSGGGPRPIQFSGGEPTVRDDLPALVEDAVDKGFNHIEVNTNGIRLAHEDGYAYRLAEAGVTAIYLQFDGLIAETYRHIRDADILEIKHQALDACREAELPVILVPTVVPGINDHEMGDIVRFALKNLDIVKSINFQPVAHFGRFAENPGRFSLDAAARQIASQFNSVEEKDFFPVPCCSSYCQLGTALLPDDDGGAVPLSRFIEINQDIWDSFSGMVDESDWMEFLAGTPTGQDWACCVGECCGMEVPSIVGDLFTEILPVTITGFMDADSADVERLSNCCISVPTASGDLVPFCAYNMTTEDGRYAIRNRHDWGGRAAVEAQQDSSIEAVNTGD